jgi:hypothetical protein
MPITQADINRATQVSNSTGATVQGNRARSVAVSFLELVRRAKYVDVGISDDHPEVVAILDNFRDVLDVDIS